MLIRFVIENVLSFGYRKEFSTIPQKRLRTLSHHKYSVNNFELLKLSSIYGANGAGKSNLIKALYLFQKLLTLEEIPFKLKNTQFKFQDKKEQVFAIEFIQDEKPFYYGIVLNENRIATEELYLSGLGKNADQLIFERKTDDNRQTEITFSEEFENDEKSKMLKSILLEEFVKANQPVLKLLSNRDNEHLRFTKTAFRWFSESLEIITPESKPRALAHKIDLDKDFKKYAEELMCSFNVGIESLSTEKKNINEFFGEDNENELDQIIKEVEESSKKMIGLRSRRGDEIIIVKEEDSIYVKSLKIKHSSLTNSALFDLEEESDGTIRLLDFVPAFKEVISKPKVYFVDEIERSIHPLLIKELVAKFSRETKSKGQLIFTTHESNLLDQGIFRQDEIWFVEKDLHGSTDLYSLSEFKEHKTIDIRKGYLAGRYGSIPFLGNLKDLNWYKYDLDEQAV
jgi:AAA15 family ATPase/GTPase